MKTMTSDCYESFAVRLRGLREERGLTQGELAAALGMGQSAVANYERGSRFPDERTLKQMAAFFGASFDYLLGGSTVRGGAGGAAAEAEDQDPVTPLRMDIATLRTSVGDLLLSGRLEEGKALAVDAVQKGDLNLAALYEQVLTPCCTMPEISGNGDIWTYTRNICARRRSSGSWPNPRLS
jgi:transcriptional regulator with XRE-family HTH domain